MAKKNSKIISLLNRYKNTLNDPTNNLDKESLDYLRSINKGLYNAPRSKNSSTGLLKRDCLDKNI